MGQILGPSCVWVTADLMPHRFDECFKNFTDTCCLLRIRVFLEVTKFKDSSLVYEEWSGGRAASVELLISVISEVTACTQVSVSQSPVDDNTKHHRPLPLTGARTSHSRTPRPYFLTQSHSLLLNRSVKCVSVPENVEGVP